MNKRGDALSILIFVVILFMVGIGFIVLMVFTNQFTNVFITNEALNSSAPTLQAAQQFQNIGTAGMENAFLGVFAVLALGLLFTSFFVRIHPAFIILYILTFIVAILLAALFGNVYEQFANVGIVDEVVSERPIIDFLLTNPVISTLAVGALSLIILFSKVVSPPVTGGEI